MENKLLMFYFFFNFIKRMKTKFVDKKVKKNDEIEKKKISNFIIFFK